MNRGNHPPRVGHNDRTAIEYRAIDKLWQPDSAPRRFARTDIKKARSILQKFGLRLPLMIKADGRVLAHFVVVLAARELGHDTLPVIIVDDLSDAECEAMSLALNRLYELGKFDRELLGSTILDLEVSVPDITAEDLGFDITETDLAIAAVTKRGYKPEPVVNIEPYTVSEGGDIWICDGHRVGCGDAGDQFWLGLLRSERLAAMVFTDKPYGCAVEGFVTTRAHRPFVQLSGGDDTPERPILFRTWCESIHGATLPGALIYLCMDWRGFPDLHAAASAVFGEMLNLIVWSKDRAGMGSLYRSQHELVLLFRAPGAPHRNNVALGKHGRNRSNVWSYPSAQTFGTGGTEGDLLADHPTPKNKDMIADAILDATKRGDVILDPFLGSGSTLIAADKVGRICYGSDLDPRYVDLAVRRWEAWSGKEAIHAKSGRSFKSLEAERRTQSLEAR